MDIYSDAHGVLYGNFNMTDQTARNGHNWDESALPEAKSVKYSPAVQNAVEVDGLMDIPAAMLEALDGKSTTLFYKFKQPLSDEDMGKALGQAMLCRLPHPRRLLCMDGLDLRTGAYLDVGRPVGSALPVVIKTLLFSS